MQTYWEDRWKNGQTGWDAGQPAPALVHLLHDQRLPHGRTLVPGCGSGYDAFALASPQRTVFGLEISPTASERFLTLRQQAGLSPHQVALLSDDFFSFQPPAPFDLIWDYTFLCALEPSLRPTWARRSIQLLAPGGILALLLFPVRPDILPGPPFGLQVEPILSLLSPPLQLLSLEPASHSHPPRQGLEWLALLQLPHS